MDESVLTALRWLDGAMDAEDVGSFEECLICGAVVSNAYKHLEWHREKGDEQPSLFQTAGEGLVAVGFAYAASRFAVMRERRRDRRPK